MKKQPTRKPATRQKNWERMKKHAEKLLEHAARFNRLPMSLRREK